MSNSDTRHREVILKREIERNNKIILDFKTQRKQIEKIEEPLQSALHVIYEQLSFINDTVTEREQIIENYQKELDKLLKDDTKILSTSSQDNQVDLVQTLERVNDISY